MSEPELRTRLDHETEKALAQKPAPSSARMGFRIFFSSLMLLPGLFLILQAKAFAVQFFGGRAKIMQTGMFHDGSILEKVDFLAGLIQAGGLVLALVGAVLLGMAFVKR